MELAGHVPIKLSRLVAGFLGAPEINSVSVQMCGRRKREMDLVVPRSYQARKKSRKFANILSKEFRDVKEQYSYFEFELEQDVSFPNLYSYSQHLNKLHQV